jgi:hypothetical protein
MAVLWRDVAKGAVQMFAIVPFHEASNPCACLVDRSEGLPRVDKFYNTRRRHSTIGYISPIEFKLNLLGKNRISGSKNKLSVKPGEAHSLPKRERKASRADIATPELLDSTINEDLLFD